MPTLSVTLPSFGPIFRDGDFHRLHDLAGMAEQAGVDRILLTDHVVMGPRVDRYPFGAFPFPPEVPWLDPLPAMAAMAAVTRRVRFCTKVLVAPLRPAAVLAKTLATMDVLSQGRMEIGVSTGWQREEYEAAGVPWAERGQRLTDTIGACRALWRDSPASFDSPSVSFSEVWCEPKPLQPGGLPVWVAGGLHERNLARLTGLADGWIPLPYATLDEVAADWQRLRSALVETGRDPSGFGVQGDIDAVTGGDGRPSLGASLESAGDWIEAGATTLNVVMSLFCGRLDRADAWFQELGRCWDTAI